MKSTTIRAILLLALSSSLAFHVAAAPKKKIPLSQKELLALKEIQRGDVKGAFKNFLKEAANQKFPSAVAWGSTMAKIKEFQELPFIEADTGFKRAWFQTIHKAVRRLAEIQTTKRACRFSGNKRVYAKLDNEFNILKDKLAKLMKNPQKIAPKRLIVLRKNANKIREAIRKKLEASGWKPPPRQQDPSTPEPPETTPNSENS
jgi:hypothetical protein